MSYLIALRVIVCLHVKRILHTYISQHLRVHKRRMGSIARTQFLLQPKLYKRQGTNISRGECRLEVSLLYLQYPIQMRTQLLPGILVGLHAVLSHFQVGREEMAKPLRNIS